MWVKRQNPTSSSRPYYICNGGVAKHYDFFLNIFANNSKYNFSSASPFQMWLDRLQEVGIRRLNHCSKRQGPYFPAHFKSAPYDTFESPWFTFSENESKLCLQKADCGLYSPGSHHLLWEKQSFSLLFYSIYISALRAELDFLRVFQRPIAQVISHTRGIAAEHGSLEQNQSSVMRNIRTKYNSFKIYPKQVWFEQFYGWNFGGESRSLADGICWWN